MSDTIETLLQEITELKARAVLLQQYDLAGKLRQIEKELQKDLNDKYTNEILNRSRL